MGQSMIRPLSRGMIHLCVDMQRLFSEEGIWPLPWMKRVLPLVTAIAARRPERTIFSRFITPRRADEMPGTWQRYYHKWKDATREVMDPAMLDLMAPLKALVPPAIVIDKTRYSAFAGSALLAALKEKDADGLIVTGSETDVCVLATVLDAVDLGLRVVLVRDGVCSASDEGHDSLLQVYHNRYSLQIETADAEDVLNDW